jgi:hypothetical protein
MSEKQETLSSAAMPDNENAACWSFIMLFYLHHKEH